MDDLFNDSVLPMPIHNERFKVLEYLLQRLNNLPQQSIVMLVDVAPRDSLPWFADHFSLFGDGWEFAITADDKKDLIKNAIEIHRHKGTPWAIKRTLKLLGYGECELQERFTHNIHDGSIRHDSKHVYADVGGWTHYRIISPRLIDKNEAERIRALLINVAPLRCLLTSISTETIYHDSSIKHDGQHKYNGAIAQWQQ